MRWWQKLILFITIIFALLLIGAMLAMYISPEKFWPLAFLGLGYFPILLCYMFFMLLWLFMRRKIFYGMLIILTLGFTAHLRHFSLGGLKRSSDSEKPVYTLMQYNVQGFDAYNKEGKYKNRDQIIANIANAKPDILCMEEFNTYTNHRKEKSNLDMVMTATGLKNYYYYKAFENPKTTRSFGLMIMTKFPIIDTGHLEYLSLSPLNTTIYADLLIENDTVRIFCSHMQSTQLNHYDLEFIEASNEAETDFDADRITTKLKMSFSLRAQEADTVATHIKASPFPMISCGDFNDTPVSYTYHKMSHGMEDAFLKRGFGVGATYAPFPFIRIDFMLFKDDAFDIHDYYTIKDKSSDHYPCITKFSIPAKD